MYRGELWLVGPIAVDRVASTVYVLEQKKKKKSVLLPPTRIISDFCKKMERGNGTQNSWAMAVSDKVLGASLIAIAALIFVYYTVWVLILVRCSRCDCWYRCSHSFLQLISFHFLCSLCIPQPFVEDSVILDLFPPRLYAIIIPATILVAVISIVGAFIGYVLLKEARKSKKK